ncbi:MAG TPA: polysaccharide deacetylase family protein [Flavihumibacter sp.]
MLIYSPEPSPRLQYVVDFISQELLLNDAAFTTDPEVFRHYDGIRINYSKQSFDHSEYHIYPHGLLRETGVAKQMIEMTQWNGLPAFFPTAGKHIGFDLFAAIFYLLSRYEEYLPHEKDGFGRFSHTSSLAWQQGFLDRPLINEWLEKWTEELSQLFPGVVFRRRSYKFIPTYDIDMLYSFRGKALWRNMGGAVRSILNGQLGEALLRWKVLRGKERDPYDAYEWLDALHLYCRVKPIYFFLVAQKQKGLDKNIPTSYKPFQELISYHASNYKIGLHPSWQSSVEDGNTIIREEKEWLEVVADREIDKSRQHFIKFSLPDGYQRLLDVGIRQDYSMGYGTVNGFRASVASSFLWYNLDTNSVTPLRVYPFCFMDATARFQQKLNPQQAYTELMKYYVAVKKVKGCFITIWHNNFLGTDRDYEGWRDVYEIFMKEDAYWDANA